MNSMMDYNYMQKNCWEVSVYLGCCKFPFANTLEHFWTANKKPLIYFMHQVSAKIRGEVDQSILLKVVVSSMHASQTAV